uniref:Tc1-like transposase DDE domain-containing protein n=1 Tax=Trichogramma kaykai TaxID=54128 RepID=A0ABD2WZH6_9HYME
MLSKEKQPYKKNKCHRLRLRHFLPRLTFCQWGLNQLRQNPDFFYDVCFTDESIFTSDGPRNQQTELMWMPKGQNPHWVDERNNYPDFKIMVFAGIVHDRIIGPYFFETNINSTIYTEFLSRVFLPQLRRVAPNAYWQQDGASPHNRRVTTELLNDNFPNRWMGLFGPIRWPAYSPDLTICDYGLWGDVKAKVKSMSAARFDSSRRLALRLARVLAYRLELAARPHLLCVPAALHSLALLILGLRRSSMISSSSHGPIYIFLNAVSKSAKVTKRLLCVRYHKSELSAELNANDITSKNSDEKQAWINCLLATRAIMCHDEVPPKLQELVWQSISTFLSTHDGIYAGPSCHEETWEPKEEGICPICHRHFSSPPSPVGPWFLAGPWD